MTTLRPTPGTGLRPGPDIHRCRLPFGGGVLVNAVTLSVVEFGEPDLAVLDRLLALGVPPPEAGAVVERLVEDLLTDDWLVVARPTAISRATGPEPTEGDGT
jgi:hypothetical protein